MRRLSMRSCLKIRMQDKVTVYRLIMVPLKGWMSSNIWQQPKQIEILFRKKLRADWSQGMLAIIQCRIPSSLPLKNLKLKIHSFFFSLLYRACCQVTQLLYRACCQVTQLLYRACCQVTQLLYRACCQVTQLLYQPLHIYKFIKFTHWNIKTLKMLWHHHKGAISSLLKLHYKKSH